MEGHFAGVLRDEHVFFDGGNLRVIEELFATVDVFGRRREHFDEERRVAKVGLLHADALAGDQHIGINKNILTVDFEAHLEVDHVGLARAAAEMGVEGGEKISRDKIVRLAGAGHDVNPAANEFVVEGTVGFVAEVIFH